MHEVIYMITTLGAFISKVKKQHDLWGNPQHVWFRGEPDCPTSLVPRLYRPKPDGLFHNENKLLQVFRMKTPSFALGSTPSRERADEWLFLAQHVGLPTRLLDWTENAILALYFALKCDKPVVWILQPMKLNTYVTSMQSHLGDKVEEIDEFPLAWFRPDHPRVNIGHENIRGAWERDNKGLDLPVAVQPTYVHPRMVNQRSVFTVHGFKKESLDSLIPSDLITKFVIRPGSRKSILEILGILGIREATASPDLDGLARELSAMY